MSMLCLPLACTLLSFRMDRLFAETRAWDEARVEAAHRKIVATGPAALPYLERAIENPSTSGWTIARAYGEIGGHSSYSKLRALAESGRSNVSSFAIRGLGATKDRRALLFLLEKLGDRHDDVAAAQALGDLGCEESIQPLADHLGDGLEGNDNFSPSSLGRACAFALARLGREGAMSLAAALNAPGSSEIARQRAAEALIQAKWPQTKEQLYRFVVDTKDELAQDFAVIALANLGDGRAFPYAVRLAASQYRDDAGYRALLNLGDSQSMAIVAKALDGSESAARGLVEALRKSANPERCKLLLRLLARPEDIVRRETIWALGEVGDADAAPALEAYWSSAGDSRGDIELAFSRLGKLGVAALMRVYRKSDLNRRVTMLELFGLAGEASALTFLREAAKDPEPAIRQEAKSALQRLLLRY